MPKGTNIQEMIELIAPSLVYCSTGGTAEALFTIICCAAHLLLACREEVLASSPGIITSWRILRDIGVTASGSKLFASAEPHFSFSTDNCDPI